MLDTNINPKGMGKFMNIFSQLGVKIHGKENWDIIAREFINEETASVIKEAKVSLSKYNHLTLEIVFNTGAVAFFTIEEGSDASLGDVITDYTKIEIIMKKNSCTGAKAQKALIHN